MRRDASGFVAVSSLATERRSGSSDDLHLAVFQGEHCHFRRDADRTDTK
jgi:hypothetical protein